MINKLHPRVNTVGMSIREIQNLLDTRVGILIENTRMREVRIVFKAARTYRIKLLGYHLSTNTRLIHKLLTDVSYANYEGSTLETFYKYISNPRDGDTITVINPDLTPINNTYSELHLPSIIRKGQV